MSRPDLTDKKEHKSAAYNDGVEFEGHAIYSGESRLIEALSGIKTLDVDELEELHRTQSAK